MKVAVYTIALNEAANAARWAQSAADADYRIVADTGSTDGTAEILERAGVIVHRIAVRPWRFDVARNAAMALIPSDVDVCCTMDMDRFLASGWRSNLENIWKPETTSLFCRVEYRSAPDDPRPLRGWPAKNFHHRWGYRFRRPVHEELQFSGAREVSIGTDSVVMYEVQDPSKSTRRQYLPLMELAHAENPADGQICFWLGREYMWANESAKAVQLLSKYLELPTSTWKDERSEAMRYLSRLQPEEKLKWLDRARLEAPNRREIWLDLAEEYFNQHEWLDLLWAANHGLKRTSLTGSYLDDRAAWDYRLFDFAALAARHLGVFDNAVDWGRKALELEPENPRLRRNLEAYLSLQAGRGQPADPLSAPHVLLRPSHSPGER